MRLRSIGILAISLLMLSFMASDADAGRRVRTFGNKGKAVTGSTKKPSGSKGEKSFKAMIKDKVAIEGLFTFYLDTTNNTMLMGILPEQFGPIFLCNETRTAAEGAFFDASSMGRYFPFYFQKVGKSIKMMEKNLRFRADTSAAMHRAIKTGITDHLFGSVAIKSKPADSTGMILIDPSDLFIRDAQHLGSMLAQAQMGVRFDKKNSYFGTVKSFPKNSEIDVKLHFAASKPLNATTMQNPYSLFHTFHYSLSTLPDSDYEPRIADDRVGYFMSMYQDYTTLDKTTPYVRYINRWNLKKKNPDARISEPVEPIVYWVENTVPKEYRDAVAEGIEFWNQSFEKIGFRNAIIAKQMPDTANWDPADVRYNTVRWILQPGGGYAVGPSRANPFTGQIYDADIRVSADFIRYMFNNMEYFIDPVSMGGVTTEESMLNLPVLDNRNPSPEFCNYGAESAKEAAFGLAYVLSTAGDLADKDELTREYVHAYIVELVAHEVGHTLGFRHNFKASTIYTLGQIQDRNFTREHSTGGTVMDYTPPNIAGKGKEQGEFYASTPGPYDDWVIEYGYTEFPDDSTIDVAAELRAIAEKASEHNLTYGTDEDAFGTGPKGIDPYCNQFDQGNDPIAYCRHKLGLTKELWENSLSKFEKDGESFQEVLRAFGAGWRSYYESANLGARFVSGIKNNRLHVGNKDGILPFEVIPASQQREAMNFLKKNIFAANAFDFSEDLLNRLQPERLPDFNWSVYSMAQIDYPIHAAALNVQNYALSRLYSPYTLGRLLNNVERVAPGADKYTMYDMFTDVRRSIWSEIVGPTNVNSYRRQLQLRHLQRIINIFMSDTPVYPSDARTLAGNDLDILEGAAKKAVSSSAIDEMTRAHYKEVLRQISAARSASRNYGRG